MKNTLLIIGLLFCLNAKAQVFTNYTTSNGLLSDNVMDLEIDANGNLWFATQRGVSMYDGTVWTSYTTASDTGLINDNIETIEITSAGDVWVGTAFGASRFSGGKWEKFTTTNGLGNNQVKYIKEVSNGDIWFATINGASRFDGSNWKSFGTTDGLPFGGVNHISEDFNGNIWLGTGLGGIEIFDGSNFTEITSVNGLLSDQVRSVVFDDMENAWVGLASGITVLDTSKSVIAYHTRPFILPPPDTLNPVEDLVIDTNKNVWASVYVDYLVTEGGICMYNGTNWTDYDMTDGLAGPNVRRMRVDGDNNLWVATSTGVSKVSMLPTSVQKMERQGDIALYPNPASDLVRIGGKYVDPGERYQIFNLNGQLVQQGSVGTQIQVSNLPAGLFAMKLSGKVLHLLIHR